MVVVMMWWRTTGSELSCLLGRWGIGYGDDGVGCVYWGSYDHNFLVDEFEIALDWYTRGCENQGDDDNNEDDYDDNINNDNAHKKTLEKRERKNIIIDQKIS